MHAKHKDAAEFLLIYIREAHPEDGWKLLANSKVGIVVEQPKSDEERGKVAGTCALKLDIKFPIVVDKIDNKVGEAYAGWPDRLYIVGADGRIVYKGGPGPKGFDVAEMARELEKLLDRK